MASKSKRLGILKSCPYRIPSKQGREMGLPACPFVQGHYCKRVVGQIKPMEGIWIAPFPRIMALVENGAPVHTYQKRKGDEINAKESYLFDLREFDAL